MNKYLLNVTTLVSFLPFSLHPGDLYPFSRKPLFVIVDSDNSSAFKVSIEQCIG